MGALDKWTGGDKSLTPERRLMNEALARLGDIQVRETRRAVMHGHARLIFALDLTASRSETLREARIATAEMFKAIKEIGSVAVKLIYYRDRRELRATGWNDDPAILSDCMQGLSCKAGVTQIARVLRFALDEQEPLSGLVFIGDCCEEPESELTGLAAQLGKRKIPLYIFHERPDFLDDGPEPLYRQAVFPGEFQDVRIFERLAGLSGGQYCRFKPDSGAALRELLSTVAAFSVGGVEAVKQVPQVVTAEARQLQSRLLLLGPGDVKGA
jgi:hypothetical protein